MKDEAHQAQLERTRAYWAETNAVYLEHVGVTFQAGFLSKPGEVAGSAESNCELARLAGLKPGDRVLDAGCGVCGPAIDIAAAWERVSICGVTLSPEQAATAKQRITSADLRGRISVAVADYHELPFHDAVFDVALFLESAGYSHNPELQFREAHRVLRPGGVVLVKDVCCKEGPLSADEQAGMDLFNRTFAYLTRRISEVSAALDGCGFENVQSEDVTHRISRAHQISALFALSDGGPTAFGKRHLIDYPALPTVYGVIRATKPL